MASGRFLSPGDVDQGGTEVVLGVRVARELFGSESPLGRVVRIGDWRFRVVGVLTPKGRSTGFDMDDLVLVPVQTAMTMLNRHGLFRILVEVRSHSDMPETRRELLALLTERHRSEDVTVISQDAMLSSFSSILRALTMALGGIASVSLAVAGIGVMNVMLVSVTERRAEIGLLKALGAGQAEILGVFLTEAVLLSMAGGLVGLAVGAARRARLRRLLPELPRCAAAVGGRGRGGAVAGRRRRLRPLAGPPGGAPRAESPLWRGGSRCCASPSGAIVGHRLRSALSALGVAIGVASVILLTSLGEGTRDYVTAQFMQFGTSLVAINPGQGRDAGHPRHPRRHHAQARPRGRRMRSARCPESRESCRS